MTVIAWDGKTLAADKRATNYGLIRTVTKIKRIGDLLVGVCGDTAQHAEAIAWIERGRKTDDYPIRLSGKDEDGSTLVIDCGRIFMYGTSPRPIIYEDPIFAIGSGRDYALAAMHLGKSACEAVKIATLFDAGCGNGVDELAITE